MIIFVQDDPSPTELSEAINTLATAFERQGVTQVRGLYLNCHVWAGSDRLQVVRSDRKIGHIDVVRDLDMPGWTAIPRGKFRVRPEDQSFNPLAILANHDD
jgi:hypothetical protein